MSETQGIVSLDPINVRIEEIRAIIQSKIEERKPFGVEFKITNYVCSGIFERVKDNSIFLKDVTQVEIGTNVPLDRPAKRFSFNISDIDMESFRVISEEEVKATNAKVISKIEMENKQGKHMEHTKSLGFEIADPDDKMSVPIKFQQESISHVVPIIEPIQPESIIAELPQQSESKEFNEKLEKLRAIAKNEADLLKGSKVRDSIDKVLSKDTQSNLKLRYDSLKQSIKAPIEKLNKQLTDSLEKIAKGHNAGISALIQKSSKAALETRRKYKIILNKTQNAVKDRLAGKSTGIVGSLKGSKLQILEKSLGNDERELDLEIDKAKRYTSLKERLLNWSNESVDKSKLTEEQIETIVNAFDFDNYGIKADDFIENLKINTMSIISLVLKVLKSELDISTKYAPQNKDKLINIAREFMESLRKMNGQSGPFSDSVEELLNRSIEIYDHPTNDVYFTPMKLYQVKDSLMSIITSAQPLISDNSDTVSERSSSSNSSSSSSSSSNQRKLNKLMERKRAAEIASDTFTPVLNRIKDDISEYIPDIKLGQVLLTTERELKTRFGKKTGDTKEKHYYLDLDGKVKKIGSTMTYKLAINSDGSIPSQLAHLGEVKTPSTASDLDIASVYPPSNSANSEFFASPFPSDKSLVLKSPSQSNLTTEGAQYGQAPAPRRTLASRFSGFTKGLGRNLGLRTSSKNTPVVEGGKRRTRKHRKNKTHKRRSTR